MTAPSTAVVERTLHIDARPEIVFGLLTDAEQMVRWQGVAVNLDARPGGIYRCQLNTQGLTTVGRFVEVTPYTRVVFTWGWEPQLFPIPPGSTTVEITLTPDGAGTVLHLRHSGLPDVPEVAESHGDGWMHYFERLAILAAGGELPYDPWRDGAMG